MFVAVLPDELKLEFRAWQFLELTHWTPIPGFHIHELSCSYVGNSTHNFDSRKEKLCSSSPIKWVERRTMKRMIWELALPGYVDKFLTPRKWGPKTRAEDTVSIKVVFCSHMEGLHFLDPFCLSGATWLVVASELRVEVTYVNFSLSI